MTQKLLGDQLEFHFFVATEEEKDQWISDIGRLMLNPHMLIGSSSSASDSDSSGPDEDPADR